MTAQAIAEGRTPPQIAKLMRVSIRSVLHWIGTGELPAVNIAAGRDGQPRWRIDESDLQSFIAARKNRPAVEK